MKQRWLVGCKVTAPWLGFDSKTPVNLNVWLTWPKRSLSCQVVSRGHGAVEALTARDLAVEAAVLAPRDCQPVVCSRSGLRQGENNNGTKERWGRKKHPNCWSNSDIRRARHGTRSSSLSRYHRTAHEEIQRWAMILQHHSSESVSHSQSGPDPS